MAISETDVQDRLNHMMKFIEQEANEKAEEIDAKAEEEFNIEKGRLVQQQRQKIMDHYEKKEKQVELQRKIQASNLLNAARLKVLKAREDNIKAVLEEAKAQLATISHDKNKYTQILKGLITAGLCQMNETQGVIKCRREDVALVQQLLPECVQEASRQNHQALSNVIVDQNDFLSADCAGGIELFAKGGKIRVSSTLESRLDLIAAKMLPNLRNKLFGENKNRRFYD